MRHPTGGLPGKFQRRKSVGRLKRPQCGELRVVVAVKVPVRVSRGNAPTISDLQIRRPGGPVKRHEPTVQIPLQVCHNARTMRIAVYLATGAGGSRQITGMIKTTLYITRWLNRWLVTAIAPIVILSVFASGPTVAQQKIKSETTVRLFESIEENNLQGVKINTIGGGDLQALNQQGKTPLGLAIDKGYFDIVFYLIAYRDSRDNLFPPNVGKTKQTAPAPKVSARQPVSAVAGLYTPPPGQDPWSATVIIPDPVAPEIARNGPSPFDPESRPPGSGLAIIGDIRGPSGPEPAAKVADAAPEITPEIASLPPAAPVDVAPVAIAALVEPVPAAPPVPSASPRLVLLPPKKPLPPALKMAKVPETPAPPPAPVPKVIEPKLVVAEPSPRIDQMAPTFTPEPEPQPPAPVEAVAATLIKPQPVPEIQVQVKPPPERKLIPIETTLPGKPKESRGLFAKIMAALSFGDDDAAPKQVARNRVVMDMPPPLASGENEGQAVESGNGWAVRKVEKTIRAAASEIATAPGAQSGERLTAPLQNINLSLDKIRGLGQAAPKAATAAFGNACIAKKSGTLVFCVVDLQWPTDLAHLFATNTVLYEGTKAIVRYDEGAATYYHTLFPTDSFARIIDYFTTRYGPPTKTIERSIAPLASPRTSNPTAVWTSIAPVTKLLTTLEVRTFDDTQGGFPDTRRGVVLLYHEWSRPVFPHVSTVELMMLSVNQQH